MKVALVLVALLSSMGAARVTTFRWEPVLLNEVNVYTEVSGFRIYHLAGVVRELVFAPGAAIYEWTQVLEYPVGEQCFVMTALGMDGAESAESNVACQDWRADGSGGPPLVLHPPKPPARFSIDP